MSKYSTADTPLEDIKENLKVYSELTQTLLFNRNITSEEEAEIFLNPDYERDIYDPFLIMGMERAVERILSAIENEEKIVIYGDYDCDGIPGSVVLHDFFKKIGYKDFENYIPHRHEEGYGFHAHAVEEFAKEGVGLVITVDCGITDVDAVKRADELGIDVIITDHHLPQETLPPAFVILNSKQKEDTYPDDMLCGAGVAWKLVQALLARGRKEKIFDVSDGWEKWLLDMAGLSTIADMVPLLKENRALAHFGLKVLRKSPRPGLQKLLRKAKVAQVHLTEDDVGFMIAPRINAASRMDVPMEAFRLLSTDDEIVAGELSEHLHNINNERKLSVAVM
jgi:single-stranded-DNA-specific exonuclease